MDVAILKSLVKEDQINETLGIKYFYILIILRSMSFNCPFKINSTYNRHMEKFIVTKVLFKHNHNVSKECFEMLYPANRLTNDLKNFDLKKITDLEPKPKKVKYMLEKKFDTFPTNKDINNLMYKSKCCSSDSPDELMKFVENFTQVEKNIAHIVKNDDNILQSIYLQLSESIHMFSTYPTVLLMDFTYKLNSLNMPLLIFMCSDNMGNGRIVASCFITSEIVETITNAIEIFKRYNPCWKKLRQLL